MEITEIVTPSVAIPVLGVLVCAFLVFAFGFKSPGQPPSFDAFDEESKKRRTKKSKGKSQSNGHALTVPDEGNISNNAKPQQSPKQPKQTLKQQVTTTKAKQASQVPEQPKKAKKPTPLKEVAKEQPVTPKQQPETVDDDDGWHTISKKDKKQKKKEERGETPIEEKYIAMEKQVVMEEPVAIVTEEKQEPAPASPQDQRQKKKKDKKAKKGKLETEVQEAIHSTELEPTKEVVQEPVIDIEIITVQTAHPELEVVAENNVEKHIQEAMETHEEEVQVVKKKSKNKKKKSSPVPESEPGPAPVQPEPVPEPPAPDSIEPELQSSLTPTTSATDESSQATGKSPKKKKKERSKANIETKSGDVDVGGASGSIEPSLSHSLTDVSKQSPKSIPESSTDVVSGPAPGAEAAAAPGSGPSFDELGGLSESWTEAKPKSKKKKARREN